MTGIPWLLSSLGRRAGDPARRSRKGYLPAPGWTNDPLLGAPRRLAFVLVALAPLVAVACRPGPEPAAGPEPGATAPPAGDAAVVDYVADGDTLELTSGIRVRLLNVDAPEYDACHGEEATAALRAALPPGTAVTLLYDEDRFDRFGRTLAHIYRGDDGVWINRELVAGGFATALLIEPNGARYDELVEAEERARRAGAGLWSACPAR